MNPVIEYRGVEKAYDAPVLSGIDLAIATGETISIVGPSGTGKTVLLKTTNGLVIPDAGDVLVDGRSIFADGGRRLDEVRRRIGYVFQYAALFDSLTVAHNVALGLHEEVVREVGLAEVARRVRRALAAVNLDPRTILGKVPAALSGGMRKRVGLARAIVGEPQVLLYDEPVTGLDPVNAAIVERLITQIGAHSSATSVVVTHDVEGALRISDRIALLDRGRLRFVGTPKEFRASTDRLVRAFADPLHAAASADGLSLEEP